jgi:hypothetical protein
MRNRIVSSLFTPPPVGLPDYLKTRPTRPEDWDRPTAWLFGTKLLGSARSLLLSAVHRGFDLRDWVTPNTIDVEIPDDDDECWIDFLADTGDSPRLVYRLAQLLQRSSLTIDGACL